MNGDVNPTPKADIQATLDCLRLAASKTLERKRRLGHYSVQWNDNAPFAIGEDAPESLQLPTSPDEVCNPIP